MYAELKIFSEDGRLVYEHRQRLSIGQNGLNLRMKAPIILDGISMQRLQFCAECVSVDDETLHQCLKHLGSDASEPEMQNAALVLERESAVQALRAVCERSGDNDWDLETWRANIERFFDEENIDRVKPPGPRKA